MMKGKKIKGVTLQGNEFVMKYNRVGWNLRVNALNQACLLIKLDLNYTLKFSAQSPRNLSHRF